MGTMTSVLKTRLVITPPKGNPMRPWIKRTLIGLFGATILVGTLSACGHHRGGMHQMSEEDSTKMRTRMLERAGKELSLDEAQKARLATLADKLSEQRKALLPQGSDPRTEMQALVAGAKFDREKALAFVDAKTGAVKSKSPEVITAAADFYDSLKPEQQLKVREFMAKRRGWGHRG
jgi:periplasmic protein CpxP/Spy